MSKNVKLSEYETIASATLRMGAKSMSTISNYARRGKVRSVSIQEGTVRKTYVHRSDIDKMIVEFAVRQKAAEALKLGDASTIHSNFPRWGHKAASTAARPVPSKATPTASTEKFWESREYQDMLRKVVAEAVETKLREMF